MPRKSNTGQRREEIVNALLAAMAEYGYEKATISLIAQKAGLASGLIHYHFKNKEEILIELVKSLAELSQVRYQKMGESATEPEGKLRAYIDARLAKGTGANPEAVAAWVVIGAEAVRQPEVRKVYRDAVARELALATELVHACLSGRGKQAHHAVHLAASLIAMIEGAFQLASAAGTILPEGYAAPMAMQLMERFMTGEPDLQPAQR